MHILLWQEARKSHAVPDLHDQNFYLQSSEKSTVYIQFFPQMCFTKLLQFPKSGDFKKFLSQNNNRMRVVPVVVVDQFGLTIGDEGLAVDLVVVAGVVVLVALVLCRLEILTLVISSPLFLLFPLSSSLFQNEYLVLVSLGGRSICNIGKNK